MKRFLEAGRLNSPRGIKGELKFSCWCDSPDFLDGVKELYLDKEGTKKLTVVSYRPNIPSIVFEGYEDRTLCAVLTGRTVYFDRYDPALPRDVIYNDDLIGLSVFNSENGTEIGKLMRIDETVGGFLYYIAGGENEYLVPAVDRYIVSTDIEKGITVNIDEGLKIGS